MEELRCRELPPWPLRTTPGLIMHGDRLIHDFFCVCFFWWETGGVPRISSFSGEVELVSGRWLRCSHQMQLNLRVYGFI